MTDKVEWKAFVYMLKCSDGTLYTGWTVNIARRLRRHATGRASKYTRARLPVEMVGLWACLNKNVAMKLEAHLKKLTRKRKLEVLEEVRRVGIEFIIDVAVAHGGTVAALPNPARHCDVIHFCAQNSEGGYNQKTAVQGFFTSKGRFVDRKEALAVAVTAGQVQLPKKYNPQDQLTSEDVW